MRDNGTRKAGLTLILGQGHELSELCFVECLGHGGWVVGQVRKERNHVE